MRNPLVKFMLPAALLLGLGAPSQAQGTPAPKPHAGRHARTGPVPARIKGLRPLMLATDQALVQSALGDLRNGMVVVVEDQAPSPLPRWPGRTSYFRVFGPFHASPALPPGLDPSKVISGGNTIGQVYPLGWGY